MCLSNIFTINHPKCKYIIIFVSYIIIVITKFLYNIIPIRSIRILYNIILLTKIYIKYKVVFLSCIIQYRGVLTWWVLSEGGLFWWGFVCDSILY